MMTEVRLITEDGEGISVEMNESETVLDLKLKLSDQRGIPVHCQHIKQRNSPVADSATMQSLKQGNSSVTLQLDLLYTLNIEAYDGSSFELEVSGHELVQNLVSTISRYLHISFNVNEIEFDGYALEYGHRISEYGISDGAVLKVTPKHKTVYLRKQNGGLLVFRVQANVTVDQIKELVEEQEDIPVRKQRIFFCGDFLHGDRQYFDYHIEHENAVHLIVRTGDNFEVYVDVPGGKTHVLDVNPDDSVDDLKETLHYKVNIPVDMQKIYLGDRLLSDSHSLGENGVEYHSTLRLDLPDDCAQITMTSPRTSFRLWVNLDETVQHLKETVAEREGSDARFVQLRCYQTVMDPAETLRHYQIRNNPIIHFSIVQPVLIQLRVTVRGTPPSVMDLQEPVSGTILNIKETLARMLNGKARDMQLFMNGRELEDSKSIRDSGILNQSNLDLVHHPSGRSGAPTVARKSIQLFVRTLTGKVVMVDMCPTDTALAIKEQIRDKEGVPISQQCLVVGGRILDDSVRLTESGIQNQSIIHLVLRVSSEEPIPVTLCMDGHTFQLSLMQNSTIGYLKEQVETRTGIARQNMTLSVEGEALDEDDSTLADNNIDESMVIQVEH